MSQVEVESGESLAALLDAGFSLDVASVQTTVEKLAPVVVPRALACALLTRSGRRVFESRHYPQFSEHEVSHYLSRLTPDRPSLVARVDATDDDEAIVCLFLRSSISDLGIFKKIDPNFPHSDAHAVLLSFSADMGGSALEEAAVALGLSRAQARLASRLAIHGDTKAAAVEAGMSYATARDTLAQAMSRVGVRKRAALFRKVIEASLGILPGSHYGEARIAEIWGLSTRQAALASLLASGASRGEAARSVGISDAVAKKELANVFLALNVSNGSELCRKWIAAQAMVSIAGVFGHEVVVQDVEPLQFVLRPSGGQIAFSDYGPVSGRTVLVVHSSSACRAVPKVLVAALQARGLRPIAIDRPGFGLTDELQGTSSDDPFADACGDVTRVLASLGVERFDVLARGGAQHAVHLMARMPDRIGRVILVGPDPPTSLNISGKGIVNAVKVIYRLQPDLIRTFSRAIIRRMTTSSVREVVMLACADSPPDRAIMEDAECFSDYMRGFSPFLTGRVSGYVSEQLSLSGGSAELPDVISDRFTVLIGSHDFLHEPVASETYWRKCLPNADFVVQRDGGRYLSFSHADLIAGLLTE